MLFARRPVTFAVAVGPILLKVAVSTNDKLPEVLREAVGNGFAEGAPDVSSVVCTT
jgi:hypothetical protein